MLAELRSCLLAALFSVASMGLASAGEVQQVTVGGVRCVGSYSGPQKVSGGFFQVQLDLHNRGEASTEVTLQLQQQWGVEDVINRSVRLEPGERFSFSPLLRARPHSTSSYAIRVGAGGELTELGLGPSDWSSGNEQGWMYFSPKTLEAGSEERWTEAWTAGSGHLGFSLGAGTYAELPTQWLAYTSLDVVVLRLDGELPPAEALDALFAWVRSGGCVILAGREPLAALKGRREQRFLDPEFAAVGGFAPSGPTSGHIHGESSEHPVGQGHHVGQGLLFVLESGGELGSEMEAREGGSAAALEALRGFERDPWAPVHWGNTGRLEQVKSELGGFGDLPLRGLMMLLVLFVVVMGPVNFLWVKRMKRPLLLLVTVPAVALVASVGLVLLGVFSQGLEVKSTSASYTFLDQVDRQATTAEVRRIFAGSSPGVGLRPEPGTGVFPLSNNWRRGRETRAQFIQELDQGRLLTGDYLPVRRPFVQALLTDQVTRLRLEVERGADAVEVSNALGGTVESLLLRDSAGDYFELSAPLAAGESQDLVAVKRLTTVDEWRPVLVRFWSEGATTDQELPPGSYLARADARELRDDCGIVVNELSGEHFIMGLFDESTGGAR